MPSTSNTVQVIRDLITHQSLMCTFISPSVGTQRCLLSQRRNMILSFSIDRSHYKNRTHTARHWMIWIEPYNEANEQIIHFNSDDPSTSAVWRIRHYFAGLIGSLSRSTSGTADYQGTSNKEEHHNILLIFNYGFVVQGQSGGKYTNRKRMIRNCAELIIYFY